SSEHLLRARAYGQARSICFSAIAPFGAGEGRVHTIRKQPGIGGGPPSRPISARYALGDVPTSSRKRVLNEPRLLNPTRRHTSVTVRFATRSRSLARSIRRRVR